jgi:hypothetical protein
MGRSKNYKVHVKSSSTDLVRIFGYKSISPLEVGEEIFLPYKDQNICVKITGIKHGLKNLAFADEIERLN